MIFEPTALDGVWLIRMERREDERGFFARTFCSEEFARRGLPQSFVQCNVSYNYRRGTLRGMHFQCEPRPEGRLVRCIMGAAYDVSIDLRKDSPTYCHHYGVEISATNRLAVYIPTGFAHGFQSLTDDTELFYQMTEYYVPNLAAGVRWDDIAFGIHWPIMQPILSARDGSYPDFVK
jgi:dTDP-4-dehydrorhamnose 3,5-epimerase